MEPTDPENERVRAIYDRRGATLIPRDGGFLFGDARHWLASRARNDTLEVGVGSRLTFAHYPPEVRLTGVEPSAAMLAAAQAQAKALGRQATLRSGDAMALEFADASFDIVVFCLVLCTVPDERRPSMRRPGSCGRAVGSSPSNMCAARTRSCASPSGCGSPLPCARVITYCATRSITWCGLASRSRHSNTAVLGSSSA